MVCGFNKLALTMAGNIRVNGIRIDFPDPLVPNFPQQIEFKALKENPIVILGVLHEEKQNLWKPIV